MAKTNRDFFLVDIANSQENLKEKFVYEVRSAPEFTVFMASERQVKEMQKYCTNAKMFLLWE